MGYAAMTRRQRRLSLGQFPPKKTAGGFTREENTQVPAGAYYCPECLQEEIMVRSSLEMMMQRSLIKEKEYEKELARRDVKHRHDTGAMRRRIKELEAQLARTQKTSEDRRLETEDLRAQLAAMRAARDAVQVTPLILAVYP
jgi:hypothetical protein